MSVSIPSAPPRSKRYSSFDDEGHFAAMEGGSAEYLKRARGSPSSTRCASDTLRAYNVGRSTVLALRALFPNTTDETINSVLGEYGDNIDAAIRHLSDLQLPEAERGRRFAAGEASTSQTTPPSSRPPSPAPSGEDWVRAAVSEIMAAQDLSDAHTRAARVLRAFESRVLEGLRSRGGEGAAGVGKRRQLDFYCSAPGAPAQAASSESGRAGSMAPESASTSGEAAGHARSEPGFSSAAPSESPSSARLSPAEVRRELALLKRAVVIQAARLGEQAAAHASQVEVARRELEETRRRLHEAEAQVYALQVHLQRAQAAGLGGPGHAHFHSRNPDVF